MSPRSPRGPAGHRPRQPPIGDGRTWSRARRLAAAAAARQERGRTLLISRPGNVAAWPDGPRPAGSWVQGHRTALRSPWAANDGTTGPRDRRGPWLLPGYEQNSWSAALAFGVFDPEFARRHAIGDPEALGEM